MNPRQQRDQFIRLALYWRYAGGCFLAELILFVVLSFLGAGDLALCTAIVLFPAGWIWAYSKGIGAPQVDSDPPEPVPGGEGTALGATIKQIREEIGPPQDKTLLKSGDRIPPGSLSDLSRSGVENRDAGPHGMIPVAGWATSSGELPEGSEPGPTKRESPIPGGRLQYTVLVVATTLGALMVVSVLGIVGFGWLGSRDAAAARPQASAFLHALLEHHYATAHGMLSPGVYAAVPDAALRFNEERVEHFLGGPKDQLQPVGWFTRRVNGYTLVDLRYTALYQRGALHMMVEMVYVDDSWQVQRYEYRAN